MIPHTVAYNMFKIMSKYYYINYRGLCISHLTLDP